MPVDRSLALIGQLWPAGSGAVVVTSPDRMSTLGAVEAYAVVPDLDRPKFLVPLTSHRAAWASVARFNALRPPGIRLIRAAVGVAMLTGVGQRALPARLTVSLDQRALGRPRREVLLSSYLADRLGAPDLAMGIGVHPPDPNAKPTAQLFGRDGRPLGFAKVGWNPATRHLVENEARALRAFSGTGIPGMQVPALLHAGGWRDRSVTVAAPLPSRVRRHSDADRLPPLALNIALSETSGVRRLPVPSSPYWRRVRRQIDALRSDNSHRELARALSSYADRLERAAGGQVLAFGHWHGDWVPWNMAWSDGTLHVWDWEHSAPDVPVGFDVLHWVFQVALVLRRRPLTEAVTAVDNRCAALLPDVGVPRNAARTVSSLYLLEMFLRTYRLMRDGSGWNPALYPAMLEVLRNRNP